MSLPPVDSVTGIRSSASSPGKPALAFSRSPPGDDVWGCERADSLGLQELQVFSMLCRADFSDDCRLSPQLYLTVIHILL